MEIKTRRETRQTLAQWFEANVYQYGYQEELHTVSPRRAQGLLNKGMSREDVAEVTTLPLTEIDKLINSN